MSRLKYICSLFFLSFALNSLYDSHLKEEQKYLKSEIHLIPSFPLPNTSLYRSHLKEEQKNVKTEIYLFSFLPLPNTLYDSDLKKNKILSLTLKVT